MDLILISYSYRIDLYPLLEFVVRASWWNRQWLVAVWAGGCPRETWWRCGRFCEWHCFSSLSLMMPTEKSSSPSISLSMPVLTLAVVRSKSFLCFEDFIFVCVFFFSISMIIYVLSLSDRFYILHALLKNVESTQNYSLDL